MATGGVEPYSQVGAGGWYSPGGDRAPDPFDGREPLSYTTAPAPRHGSRTAVVLAGLSAITGLVLWVVGLVRQADQRPPLAWWGVIGMSLPQLLWLMGAFQWI